MRWRTGRFRQVPVLKAARIRDKQPLNFSKHKEPLLSENAASRRR